jgi:hypothetical protein
MLDGAVACPSLTDADLAQLETLGVRQNVDADECLFRQVGESRFA